MVEAGPRGLGPIALAFEGPPDSSAEDSPVESGQPGGCRRAAAVDSEEEQEPRSSCHHPRIAPATAAGPGRRGV